MGALKHSCLADSCAPARHASVVQAVNTPLAIHISKKNFIFYLPFYFEHFA
jgi:hypothetical protein